MRHAKLLVPVMLAAMTIVSACTAIAEPTQVPVTALPTSEQEPAGEEAPPPGEETPPPAPPATETTEPQAALVNGQPISLAEYERQVGRYEASIVAAGQDPLTQEGQQALSQGRQWVLDMMIEQMLIEQRAAQEGITVSDEEVNATIESLRAETGVEAFDDWLAQEGMTLEEMRERLRGDMIATQMANRVAEAVPARAEHIHARHILVASEEEARQLLSQLQAGADFAALARTFSQDISTRDVGGDLGFFSPGVLTSKEVEAAAFSLQPGQLSDVVRSDLGFHIVQVVDRVADQEIAPENLRLLRDQAVRAWLDELRASADLQVFVTP